MVVDKRIETRVKSRKLLKEKKRKKERKIRAGLLIKALTEGSVGK